MAMIVHTAALERQQMVSAIVPANAPPGLKTMLAKGDSDVASYLAHGPLQAFAKTTAKICTQPYSDMLAHFRGRVDPRSGLHLLPVQHYTGTLQVTRNGKLKISKDFALTMHGKIQVLTRSEGVVAREFVDWLSNGGLTAALNQTASFRAAMVTRQINRSQHNQAFAGTVAAATHAAYPARAAQRSSQDFQMALRHDADKAAFGRSTRKEIIAANNGDPDNPQDHAFLGKKTANSFGSPEYIAKITVQEQMATAMATQFGIPFNEAKRHVIKSLGDSLLPKDLHGNTLDATTTRKRNFNMTFATTGVDSTMEPARRRQALAPPTPGATVLALPAPSPAN